MRATFLCGLIGAGIQLSRSPALHEREADEQGLRYVYKLIDLDKLGVGVEALPELLTAAKRMGFAGLNITYPCKQAIIPLLDGLSEDARALNAVNTVRSEEHTSELQSPCNLVCRLLLEKKKKIDISHAISY